MSSKAMTIRIFDSKTDESVVIITDAKKSRIRELVAVKGSFWDIVKRWRIRCGKKAAGINACLIPVRIKKT